MIFMPKKLNKIALSRTNDKRIIMEDGDMGTFDHLFITLLWSSYGIGQTIIFSSCRLFFFLSFYLFSSPNLSRRRLDVCHAYFHTWCGLSANLRCRSETCCTRLAENTGRKKVAKNRHLGTIAQLCRDISLQLRHISTIGKNFVKHQYVLHMSS